VIKLEHHVFSDRGIVAFAAESSSADEVAILDILQEIINNPGKYSLEAGFTSSNRLVIYARGWSKEEFEAAKQGA